MIHVLFLALVSLSASPKVALLPCDPHVEATDDEAAWLDRKLQRELRSRVDLVPRQDVIDAMTAQGVDGSLNCDDECLAKIGKAVGADRVVSQTLSLQKKVQSVGTVWVWAVHQVDVSTGKPFGHFERACMCSRKTWNVIARKHAEKLVEFDPAKRIELANPIEARPTKGPADIPGMVYIPAGEFIMGSEWGEFDEEPRHEVYLDAFYIDKYQTTNEEYARCVEAKKCARQTCWHVKSLMDPTQPVAGVGWYDALAYCRFADKRMPTEAQWEKAARGTDERRYPWGDEWRPQWVNTHHSEDGFETTAPVGSFPKNVSPYGVYDMAGNVWEWTHDFHSTTYYRHSEKRNPRGPKTGDKHTMRGGSWMYDVPFFMTAANRSAGRPLVRKRYVGFRCVKDVPQVATQAVTAQ